MSIDFTTRPRPGPALRAAVLCTNFLLIILAYYHVKPASRSLFVQYLGADNLPYVWIGTALFLGGLIGIYHRLVARYSRIRIVLFTCLTFIVLLGLFYRLLNQGSAASAVVFYIFVDIFSVVLVEQFWSLTNTVFDTADGKRWYGLIATGGLVGGVTGSALAAFWIQHYGLGTDDLLLVAAALVGLIFLVNLVLYRMGLFRETGAPDTEKPTAGDLRDLAGSRYLLLIATILLLSQLAQPLVEYQFIKSVEIHYTDLDQRTAYLSSFFAVMGSISIAVNLLITPAVHRYLGVIAGLTVQPLLLSLSSFAFLAQPTLLFAAAMKVCDRGLSYSINRASKELLYVPIDPVRTYQAKAWIDMLGYRLFKVLGSVLILLVTQWLPVAAELATLSWFTIGCCVTWLFTIVYVSREYQLALAAVPVGHQG